MATILDTLVFGLQEGAMYALVALGIALVYKATKVLNFAHGEVGTVAAFAAYTIMVGGNIATGTVNPAWLLPGAVIALAVAIGLSIGVGALIQRLPVGGSVISLVTTVAITLVLIAAQVQVFEIRGRAFPRFLEGAPCLRREAGECVAPLMVGNVTVSWHTLLMLATLAGIAALLTAFFRTRLGTVLLASSQDPFAAELYGVSRRTMGVVAWGLAGALAGIAGLFAAGVYNNVHPALLFQTFLIPGFTAAVLGGMTSMTGAVAGGLLLGLIVSSANQIVQTFALPVPGPPHAAVLLVLLIVLFVRPQGLLGRHA